LAPAGPPPLMKEAAKSRAPTAANAP